MYSQCKILLCKNLLPFVTKVTWKTVIFVVALRSNFVDKINMFVAKFVAVKNSYILCSQKYCSTSVVRIVKYFSDVCHFSAKKILAGKKNIIRLKFKTQSYKLFRMNEKLIFNVVKVCSYFEILYFCKGKKLVFSQYWWDVTKKFSLKVGKENKWRLKN